MTKLGPNLAEKSLASLTMETEHLTGNSSILFRGEAVAADVKVQINREAMSCRADRVAEGVRVIKTSTASHPMPDPK